MNERRVGLLPGEGVIVRDGDVIVVTGLVEDVPALLEILDDAIRSGVDADDRCRQVARAVLDTDDPPPVAVAVLGEVDAAVFLFGDSSLSSPTVDASGRDHVLGISRRAPVGDGFELRLGPPGPGGADVAAWSDLVGGVVPGVGVVVEADPPESEETVDTPVVEAVSAPFEAVSFTGGVDLSDRLPLPVALPDEADADDSGMPLYERPVHVVGVYSPKGFFNHPDAKFCSRTGVKIGASMTKVLTQGPRPPLGVVTLDDGSTLTVRWNTVIGRDPSVDEMVQQEQAAPFVVTDVAQSVSRRHALLELVDWDVYLSDLGSRNHTYVQATPDGPLRELEPGERVILESGMTVHFGRRSFVYHEHHVR